MTLQARSLTCRRGNRLLFSDLNFELAPGQATELRGSNGSGKTSLLRILSGLSEPESGEVLWQGESIRARRLEYGAELAYVGHMHALKADLTAIENLSFHQSLTANPSNVSLREALSAMGFEGKRIYRLPARYLSAGQRKRVALARLLLSKARVWLLDEPLTALDDASVSRVEELVERHVQSGGMLVVATHRPLRHLGHPVQDLRLD